MASKPIWTAMGLFLAISACERTAWAQANVAPPAEEEPQKPFEVKEIVLNVSRQKPPTPLLRYQLLPSSTELNPGDAAPIYLRLDYYLTDGLRQEINLKITAWLNQSLETLPASEAKSTVDNWAGKFQQIEFGSRRQNCDWNYTIFEEKDNPFAILLPDIQKRRFWGRFLAVKARVEIASGHAEEAIKTLETGIAFGRHVAKGPYYINVRVGLSIINRMLARVDELISQPGTPNLYWALTALPQPLISIRESTENERASMGRAMTGQSLSEIDLSQPRSDTQWSAMLAQLHTRMVRLIPLFGTEPGSPPIAVANLDEFKATMLPKARDYLASRRLTATSNDHALVLATIGLYRELADEHFKLAYIPYPEVANQQAEVTKQVVAAKSGPASTFVEMLANVQGAQLGQVRLARKIAALRVIEALRMYAAEHNGELPGSLDQIKAVPIPLDPFTNKPFEYRRDGEAAVLTGQSDLPVFQLVYRITIRK